MTFDLSNIFASKRTFRHAMAACDITKKRLSFKFAVKKG